MKKKTEPSNLCLEKDMCTYSKEATLTKKVKEWLALQPDVKFDKISDRFTKGIPDILACVGGYYVAIELKADDKEPSPHQRLFLKELERASGIGGVCETLAQVKALVERARSKKC
jgi:hypothetical protein